ncbi:MAG: SAM-dependent methyltransferase [Acidobacteriota bacterium]
MDGDSPSRTSIWAAAARAVGSRTQPPQWHNPDKLADKLIGPAERELLGEHPLAAAMEHDTLELRRNPEVMSAVMTLIVRTKFIDESLQRAIANGATQVVILGAGWDTRARRFPDLLRNARVFEVDHPATQNWKRRRAEEVLGPGPANLTYLPIDFRHQSLADVLAAGGYDPSRKTCFIWEGVTMYLPEAAVRETLQWIARQAPGSSLVFDFAHSSLIDFIDRASQAPELLTDTEKLGAARLRQITSWGEPWIFGIPGDADAAYVQQLGLEHQETLGMASIQAAKRYLDWQEDRPFPAIRAFYSIMQVTVPQRAL